MKMCRKCKQVYPDVFFYQNTVRKLETRGFPKIYRLVKLICIGCQIDERTTKKRRDRPHAKAYRTLTRHADKYIRLKLIENREKFAEMYGWDLDRMAADIEHGYKHVCPYCDEKFTEMGNGLSDITLDILNPKMAPYYRTNVRWCCSTCNQTKRRLSPEEWEEFQAAMKKWKQAKGKRDDDPYAGLPLLEGL